MADSGRPTDKSAFSQSGPEGAHPVPSTPLRGVSFEVWESQRMFGLQDISAKQSLHRRLKESGGRVLFSLGTGMKGSFL